MGLVKALCGAEVATTIPFAFRAKNCPLEEPVMNSWEVVAWFAIKLVVVVVPHTVRADVGLVVPMPTLPLNIEVPVCKLVPCTVRLYPGVDVPTPTIPVAVFTNKVGVLLVATFKLPHTSNLLPGLVVPMPTLPVLDWKVTLLVVAPLTVSSRKRLPVVKLSLCKTHR